MASAGSSNAPRDGRGCPFVMRVCINLVALEQLCERPAPAAGREASSPASHALAKPYLQSFRTVALTNSLPAVSERSRIRVRVFTRDHGGHVTRAYVEHMGQYEGRTNKPMLAQAHSDSINHRACARLMPQLRRARLTKLLPAAPDL